MNTKWISGDTSHFLQCEQTTEFVGRISLPTVKGGSYEWFVYDRGAVIKEQGEEASVEDAKVAVEKRQKLFQGYSPRPMDIAFHEAGHAVCAYCTEFIEFCGPLTISLPYSQVPVRVNRDLLDNWLKKNNYVKRDADKWLGRVLAAGSVSETKFLREQGLNVDERIIFIGATGDLTLAKEMGFSGKWHLVCDDAKNFLSDNVIWCAVSTIAHKLHSEDISECDAKTMIQNALMSCDE